RQNAARLITGISSKFCSSLNCGRGKTYSLDYEHCTMLRKDQPCWEKLSSGLFRLFHTFHVRYCVAISESVLQCLHALHGSYGDCKDSSFHNLLSVQCLLAISYNSE